MKSRVIVFFDGLTMYVAFNVFNQYAERTTVVVGAFPVGASENHFEWVVKFRSTLQATKSEGLAVVVLDIQKIYWEVCNRFVALPTGAILFFIGSSISFC